LENLEKTSWVKPCDNFENIRKIFKKIEKNPEIPNPGKTLRIFRKTLGNKLCNNKPDRRAERKQMCRDFQNSNFKYTQNSK
jgi:hypothetical protein